MKDRIIKHAMTEYNSSPHEFTDEEIEIIIAEDCKCSNCGLSIFDMDDFPEVVMSVKVVMCEECYDEYYRDICPLCEDSYEIKDVECDSFPKSPFFYYNPCGNDDNKSEYSEHYQHQSGVYEAIDYPVFVAACGGLGYTHIIWENVRLICTADDFLKANSEDFYKEFFSGDDLKAEFVCDSCWLKAEKVRESISTLKTQQEM